MEIAPALFIILLSAIPFFEARYAIPVAIYSFGFSPAQAFALGIAGNIIPVIALLLLLDPVSAALSSHFRCFETFFSWLFSRTRRHSERFERWGALALVPFVAVPLPVTGAWSGCAAAFVFGIRFRYALPAIVAGMVIAALLTTIGITSVQAIIAALGGFA